MTNYFFNLPYEIQLHIKHFIIISAIKTTKKKIYNNKWIICSKKRPRRPPVLPTNLASLYYSIPFDSYYQINPSGIIPPPQRVSEVLVVYNPWKPVKISKQDIFVISPHTYLIRDGAQI